MYFFITLSFHLFLNNIRLAIFFLFLKNMQQNYFVKNNQNVLYHKINRRFTIQEDNKLKELVSIYGEKSWILIASKMGNRNSRQCKERWCQYLSPSANKNPWTKEEEERLKILVKELNGKWIEIAKHFNGRADAQIRNKWKTLQRRMGLLPKKKNFVQYQTAPRKAVFAFPVPINILQSINPKEEQQYFDNFQQSEDEDLFNFNIFEEYEDNDLLNPDFSYV